MMLIVCYPLEMRMKLEMHPSLHLHHQKHLHRRHILEKTVSSRLVVQTMLSTPYWTIICQLNCSPSSTGRRAAVKRFPFPPVLVTLVATASCLVTVRLKCCPQWNLLATHQLTLATTLWSLSSHQILVTPYKR